MKRHASRLACLFCLLSWLLACGNAGPRIQIGAPDDASPDAPVVEVVSDAGCLRDADCDDFDDCTQDVCWQGSCLHIPDYAVCPEEVECVPDCAGRKCGDNGCGGACPPGCDPGCACVDGQCAGCVCVPACLGKQCGPDGCGGVCGECDPGCSCVDGQCKGCVCLPDCDGKECGGDGCGGSCGICLWGECDYAAGWCVCEPDCWGKECGYDGCGGSCGTCPAGCECGVFGDCLGECETEVGGFMWPCEDNADCLSGWCVEYYGKQVCTINCVEDCPDGWECKLAPSTMPDVWYICVPAGCEPSCWGKECGSDGCSGSCGSCPGNWTCQEPEGMCVPYCTASCLGKECGSDGCNGTCGTCQSNEFCSNGLCIMGCDADSLSFSDSVQKEISEVVGKGGHPGEALDLDQDPDTCSPQNDCEGGLDNQLSGLFDQLGQFVDWDLEMLKLLDEGKRVLLAEAVGFNTQGKKFTLNLYQGVPVAPKEECDFQEEVCEYYVSMSSLDLATCTAVASFDNALVKNGNDLTAGGPGYTFPFVALFGPMAFFTGEGSDASPLLTGRHATLSGDLIMTAAGGVAQASGVIGYALVKQEMLDAVDQLPADQLPVSPEMLKNLLEALIKCDLDTDGDGELDAASIGIKFTTIGGKIAGISE